MRPHFHLALNIKSVHLFPETPRGSQSNASFPTGTMQLAKWRDWGLDPL